MTYCNLKFGYKKASVKSTTLQNCTGKKKHTLANKTTPNLMEHKCAWQSVYCDQTKPLQGVYFFTNTVKEGTV